MDGLSEGRDAAQVRTDVVNVALRHHLISQYTSLVAVDKTPQGALVGAPACKSQALPIGNDPSEESLPQTATPATVLLLIGISLIGIAAALVRMS